MKKRLKLKKVTLRNLDSSDLGAVAGGVTSPRQASCNAACSYEGPTACGWDTCPAYSCDIMCGPTDPFFSCDPGHTCISVPRPQNCP